MSRLGHRQGALGTTPHGRRARPRSARIL